MAIKQRIPKDITVLDLVMFAESIGCIVDIHFVDKKRPTKRAADSPKAGGKSAKRKVVKSKVTRPAKSG